jgi:hypothetical protein
VSCGDFNCFECNSNWGSSNQPPNSIEYPTIPLGIGVFFSLLKEWRNLESSQVQFMHLQTWIEIFE